MPVSTPTATTRRSRLLFTLLAVFAALGLVTGACSSDEQSQEQQDEAQSTGETDGSDETDDSSADFATTLQEAQGALEEATDACDVFDAVSLVAQVDGPVSSDDARAATEYYLTLLTKMGETSSDPQAAETLAKGAEEFRKYAESVDYDSEALDLNGAGPAYPGAEETEAAMDQWLNTELTACVNPSLSVPAS